MPIVLKRVYFRTNESPLSILRAIDEQRKPTITGLSFSIFIWSVTLKWNGNSTFHDLNERRASVQIRVPHGTQRCIAIAAFKRRFPAHPAFMELWQTRDERPPGRTFVTAQSKTANKLLSALSADDFALIEPDLEAVELTLRRQLERRNQPVEKVYFIDSGLGSMVMNASPNHMVEVGIIGNEGMTGFAVLLDAGNSTYETFIQTAGTGRRISAEKLRRAMAKSPSLHHTFLRYVHVLITQISYTALANARYKLEERLARWLLMADDRAEGEPIRLTHEFLSVMLGSRRAGVTVALSEFQKRGILQTKRGAIIITQRDELIEAANGSYGAPEVEYRQLFGADNL